MHTKHFLADPVSRLFVPQVKAAEWRFFMGVVIGRLDGQVARIFLGNNLTKSTRDYEELLADETLSEEERERILAAARKKEEDEIIL